MARNRWRGDAPAVKQVSQFQVTGAGTAGDTITIVISNKSVVATVPATPTVATVAAACVTALEASTEPEFTEVDWTTDGVDLVIGTAATAGVPFEIDSATASGTVTVGSVSTTTDSKGPNHWDDDNNWSLGAVPVNTNDVDIIDSDVDIKWGLAQSGVTLASLNIHSTYTGKIGLPSQQGDYTEYRQQELAIGATTVTIGAGDGSGSPLIKLNTGSVQTTVLVLTTSTAGLQGQPAVWWRGTHASNAITVNRGVVGVAYNPGDAATVTTLRVGSRGSATDAQVYCSSGTTLTTLVMGSGVVSLDCTLTTITIDSGELTLTGTSVSITTANIKGGTFNFDGTGTITTTVLGTGAQLVCDRDPRTPKTFTNITVNSGSGLSNSSKTATFTNGIIFNCEIEEVRPLKLGDLITVTVA